MLREVTRFVRSEPERVCHLPDAVQYLASSSAVEADAPEVSQCSRGQLVCLSIEVSLRSRSVSVPEP